MVMTRTRAKVGSKARMETDGRSDMTGRITFLDDAVGKNGQRLAVMGTSCKKGVKLFFN